MKYLDCLPVSPTGPKSPSGPTRPSKPVSPRKPLSPKAPTNPSSPFSPFKPKRPFRPLFPSGPSSPRMPWKNLLHFLAHLRESIKNLHRLYHREHPCFHGYHTSRRLQDRRVHLSFLWVLEFLGVQFDLGSRCRPSHQDNLLNKIQCVVYRIAT